MKMYKNVLGSHELRTDFTGSEPIVRGGLPSRYSNAGNAVDTEPGIKYPLRFLNSSISLASDKGLVVV